MSRSVIYTELGGPEVLHIVDVEPPHPEPGQVRVRVAAAGLNPLDAKLFRGAPTASGRGATVPAGNGNDFAGSIDEIGADVTGFELGDQVFGGLQHRAQADFLVIDPARLARRPDGLEVEQAAGLDTAGRTAWATVHSQRVGPDDTVFVNSAAGGVGILTVQLARLAGATVIGSASEANHELLRSLGVIPVEYGEGMVDAIRATAPQGVTVALDNHGRDGVEAALALDVEPARINSIADYAAEREYGTASIGASAAGIPELEQLAALIASGEIVLPIDSLFPLERVVEAYTRLLGGHVQGKIVLML